MNSKIVELKAKWKADLKSLSIEDAREMEDFISHEVQEKTEMVRCDQCGEISECIWDERIGYECAKGCHPEKKEMYEKSVKEERQNAFDAFVNPNKVKGKKFPITSLFGKEDD